MRDLLAILGAPRNCYSMLLKGGALNMDRHGMPDVHAESETFHATSEMMLQGVQRFQLESNLSWL